ncbi:DMT family transporter [bacterium]|nr:DMT family transporter [bacterium]NUN45912.1 EamA family transporter [bacterium]
MARSAYFKGVIFICLSAVCWSSAGLFIKLVNLPPVHIAMYRSLIAGIFLLGYILYRRHARDIDFDFSVNRHGLITAIFYFFTVSLFVTANKMTTAANAVFMQYTSPVFVILITYFFLKEKIYRAEILTVVICLGGMVLFFLEEEKSTAFAGNMIAILSGVAFAFLQIYVKRSEAGTAETLTADQHHLRSIFAIVIGNLVTVMMGFVSAMFLMHAVTMPDALAPIFGTQFTITTSDIIGLLILGIFQLGCGYLFFAAGAKYISSVEIAIYTILEPILNPIWTFLGTGEVPGFWAIIGANLIVAAMLVNTFFNKERA